jgi:hypothetical protein
MQGGCKVLALFKRRRKVNFDGAWRALQSNGVNTYAVWYMKLCKVHGENGKSDTA